MALAGKSHERSELHQVHFERGELFFFSAEQSARSEFMSRHMNAHELTTLVDVVCVRKTNSY